MTSIHLALLNSFGAAGANGMVCRAMEALLLPLYRLIQQVQREGVFTPEETTAITEAFEAALRDSGLVNRADPLVESVAVQFMELAKTGERDRERLLAQILAIFRQSSCNAG